MCRMPLLHTIVLDRPWLFASTVSRFYFTGCVDYEAVYKLTYYQALSMQTVPVKSEIL